MFIAAVRGRGRRLAVSAFVITAALLSSGPLLSQPSARPGHCAPAAALGTGDHKLLLRQSAAQQSFTFVPNAGQEDPADLFEARGSGFSLGLQKGALELRSFHVKNDTRPRPAASNGGLPSALPPAGVFRVSTARMEFAGANPDTRVEGLDPAAARVNYIQGKDPAQWKSNLHGFSRVRYSNLYPGIDLIYYGERERHLEFDLVVAPGADPRQVRLRVTSEQGASIDADGNLRLTGTADSMSLLRPVLYQDSAAGKDRIAGSFVQLSRNEFGFAPGAYDRTRPLVIDPTINMLYATYAGGIHNDEAFDLTLDSSGNTYITGWSASQDFPVTGNAYQQTRQNIGSYVYDVVVMKFDSSGNLIFSTFLGGAQNDQGNGIRIDAGGMVYIAGTTNSSDFPVTTNALQKTYGGGNDAFFSVLSNDGSQLIYSTYLGGGGDESAFRLIQGANDSFWIAGGASAAGLPVTTGAYQATVKGVDTDFVANLVFNPANAQPLTIPALTFIGGSTSGQEGSFNDLALDATGNVYATGGTTSTDFPTTANAYQTGSQFTLSGGCYNSANPNSIATVVEFSSNLKTLIYSSMLGGKVEDQNGYPVCNQFGRTIHPDGKGNIWVIGTVGMQDFPTTSNALSRQLNLTGGAGVDLSIAELTPGTNSTTLTYGSYLGGSGFDYGSRAAWDSNGDIWITATTQSFDYPGIVKGTSLQSALGGGYDTVVTELQPDGTKILYATYLGGSGDEDANSGRGAIALDANNNIYLTGGTGSGNYPVTGNASQYTFANGDSGPDGYDIYYAVLGSGAIGATGPANSGNTGDATVTITGAGFQSGATCSLVLNGTTINATTAAVANNGTSIACTFALNGATAGAYNVVVTNPNSSGTFTQAAGFTVTSGGQPNVWVNVVARPKIRTGVPSVVTVNYGNSGAVDAYFSSLRITLPPNVSATYDIGVTNNIPVGTQIGTAATTSAGTQIPLFLPHLAAGSSGSFNLTITDNVNADTYTIGAEIGQPWYTTAQAATAELTSQSNNFVPATSCVASPVGQQAVGSCLGVYLAGLSSNGFTNAQVQAQAANLLLMLQQSQTGFTPLISSGTSYVPVGQLETGTLVVSGIPSFDNYVLFHVMQTSQRYLIPITSSNCVPDEDNIGDAIGGLLLKCTFTNVTAPALPGIVIAGESLGLGMSSSITPEPDACFTVMQNVVPTTFTITTRASEICGTGQAQDYPYGPGKDPLPFPDPWDPPDGSGNGGGFTGGSIDPNDKTGGSGDLSTSHFVRPTIPLPYSVYFENEATATLPAANVVVTDQLDPTKYNLKSLTLGNIYFGGNVITVPFNVSSYNTVYKISSSLQVRIQGSIDTTSGLLKWTFTSLDPTTGLPPTDPTVGFLPPDTDGIVGQGSVTYNVMPVGTLSTGTSVTNTAQVVFDANAPIVTPTWLNTIDATAPVSKVSALPANTPESGATTPFTVSWSGTDQGSGIKTYTIYVSNNGGAYTVWQQAVTATSGSYTGQTNHTYAFYSIATDGAGNVEAAKTAPEATTTISLQPTTTTLTSSAPVSNPGTAVTFTATVAPTTGSGSPTGSVMFLNGSTMLGSGTITAGKASYTTSTLALGTYSITAIYSGDPTFAASTSSALTELIASPGFTFSVSPSSLSFPAGQTGTAVFTATPVAGYNQPVSFSCSGLPRFATCAFAPATVTPSGATVTTTLSIATDVATAASRQIPQRPGGSVPAYVFAALIFAGFGGLRRSRVRTARLFSALLFATLFSALYVLNGCGGGNSNATPQGTSTIVVTATGGSVTQTASLSVTIQ